MSTPETIKAQLTADIATANAATGAADGTVHDAIIRLALEHKSTIPEADGLSEFADTQYRVEGGALEALSDAISEKSGTPAPVWPEGFAEGIGQLDKVDPRKQWTWDDIATGAALSGDIVLTCETVRGFAFRSATVTSVQADAVKHIGASAFAYCTNLTKMVLPEATSCGSEIFAGCQNLKTVDFGKNLELGGWTSQRPFSNCTGLDTLILRDTGGVCTLSTYHGLTTTAIGKAAGYIYVPAALVETYKAATNWVTYADQIRAIEDYPEICGEVTA